MILTDGSVVSRKEESGGRECRWTGKRSGMRMKKRREDGPGRMSLGGWVVVVVVVAGWLFVAFPEQGFDASVRGSGINFAEELFVALLQERPPTITGACMTHKDNPFVPNTPIRRTSPPPRPPHRPPPRHPVHLATPIFKQPPTTSTASQSTVFGAASPSAGASPSVAPSVRSACCLCLMAMYVRVLRKCCAIH